MKTKFTITMLLALVFQSTALFSQTNFNRFSFDVAAGYNAALNPYLPEYNSNFSGFKHLEFGLRYMFDEKKGLRLNYANDRFENDQNGIAGTDFNRVGLDFVYNIGSYLNLDFKSRNTVTVLTHAGLGLTVIKPFYSTDYKQFGSLVLGITPEVKLSNTIALFTDVSLNTNFKQYYRYDGSLISSKDGSQSGAHVTVSLGLIFSLGKEQMHADWY